MSEANKQLIREKCEQDFVSFIRLVAPYLLLGNVHIEACRWLTRQDAKDNLLMLLPRGHLKALPIDEPVLTPNGWVNNGDLKVGDLVIGRDGKPTEVVATHPITEMDFYQLITRDGRRVRCNAEHLWTVQIPSNTGDKEVVKSTEYLASMYRAERLDKRNGKEYTEYRVFIPNCEAIQFEEKELPIDPYTLGFWLGDGNSCQAAITTFDEEVLSYIPYGHSRYSEGHYGLLGLRKPLREENLLGNKHIPEDYMFGSIEQRKALLAGLMDSDGSVQADGMPVFYNTNYELILQVVDLIRSLGGTAQVSSYIANGFGKEVVCYAVSVKIGFVPFKLQRKVEKCKEYVAKNRNAIVSLKKNGRGLGRCITVANEDGLFITKDYLLTHNSKLTALLAAWWVTRDPTTTLLYVSATATLAEAQLFQVKQVFESKIYSRYWPEYVNPEEAKREKWSVDSIAIDHPLRRAEGIRDMTIRAVGLTANTTGLHSSATILDDIVVPGNAYTEEGRNRVAQFYSQLASIESPNAKEVIVGTRYHPRDLYDTLINMEETVWNTKEGEYVSNPVFEVFIRTVETDGEFLWPVSTREDGKKFGFDDHILARIKAKYIDTTQFYAQYYNNPNAAGSEVIPRDKFQYYDRKHLTQDGGNWYFKSNKLNVFAAIDFAFSLKKKADFTALVVVGVDSDNNYYVLEIDRFKTDRIREYYDHILNAHIKWGFRLIRAEVTIAQQAIVSEIRETHIKPQGLALSIDEYRPTRHDGDKAERIEAILAPRYDNLQIWHYNGGNTQILEEELVMQHAPHDDVKESLANAIAICKPPKRGNGAAKVSNIIYHSRFGGVTN